MCQHTHEPSREFPGLGPKSAKSANYRYPVYLNNTPSRVDLFLKNTRGRAVCRFSRFLSSFASDLPEIISCWFEKPLRPASHLRLRETRELGQSGAPPTRSRFPGNFGNTNCWGPSGLWFSSSGSWPLGPETLHRPGSRRNFLLHRPSTLECRPIANRGIV